MVPHAVDTLGAEGDSHILPGAVRKVSQCCLMDKNIVFHSNRSITEATGFKGTIAVDILYIKYMN